MTKKWQRQERWREKNPEKMKEASRRHHLKVTFGMTLEEYDNLLAKQGGVCAICRGTNQHRNSPHLVVDHNHDTGKIRGLLCHACNVAIGYLKDDPLRARLAAEYLERHESHD